MSLHRYERYKNSGISWLGEIPSHWQIKRLKRLCKTSPSNVDKHAYEDEIPVLLCNYTDVYYNERITRDIAFMPSTASVDQVQAFTLRAGDTIITKDSETADDIAIAAYVPADLDGVVCGYHLSIVRPGSEVHGEFIKRVFDSHYAKASFAVLANGLTRVGLSKYALDNFVLAIPPRSEQILIVRFLSREISKLDSLISEQRRLLELLKETRQAVITHSVTQGLNREVRMRPSGIEWLSNVPAHWRSVPLKHLAKTGAKTFTDGDWIEAPYITNEGVRLIQTGNVGVGFYKEQGFRYVSDETFEKLHCTEVKPSDVLICRLDGPVGRACLAPDLGVRMITSVDNAILKVAEDVLPEFVVALLSSVPWISWIDALCRVGGGFRLRVSRNQLGDQRVPLPPFGEQVEIALYLASETAKWDALATEARRAIEVLQERRTALISAIVTGKFDVRAMSDVQPETEAAA